MSKCEHRDMNKLSIFISGGFFLLFVLLVACLSMFPDGKLHVYALDVGQGDSVLIQTPAREYILVDGGPDDRVVQKLSEIMPFYVRSIDVMVLTHPHADHINGLVEILKRYQVRRVMMTGVSYPYSGYNVFLKLVREKEIPILFVDGSRDFRLHGVILDILYPFTAIQGRSFENLNNSSLVFRLIYGGNIFYFSGDLEMEKELELVERGLDLRANVFKAGHHGSRTSNAELLLEKMKPQAVMISCGIENTFHHPHPETIQHFLERNIQVFRTDLQGTVEATSNGREISVR